MTKKIDVDLFDFGSINYVINEIGAIKKKVLALENDLPKALADIGVSSAQAIYNTSPREIYVADPEDPDSVNSTAYKMANIDVTVEKNEEGYDIVARGEDVAFVEFGAGVFYNGEESYLGQRPSDIVGIGEYGKGYGKRKVWGFNDGGEKKLTYGTPASNALYFASQDILESAEKEARRIWDD